MIDKIIGAISRKFMLGLAGFDSGFKAMLKSVKAHKNQADMINDRIRDKLLKLKKD